MAEHFKIGDSGLDIQILQEELAAAGFDPGVADGSFGPKTSRALQKFRASQAVEGLGDVADVEAPKLRAAELEKAAAGLGTTPILQQAAVSTPKGTPDSFIDKLGRGLSDPILQNALLQIGRAIDTADPSKAEGFGSKLAGIGEQLIRGDVRANVLRELAGGGIAADVPGVELLTPEELSQLQQVSVQPEEARLKKELTTAQTKRIKALTVQIKAAGTFKEEAALARQIAIIRATARGIRNPVFKEFPIDAEGNESDRLHSWLVDPTTGDRLEYAGPAEPIPAERDIEGAEFTQIDSLLLQEFLPAAEKAIRAGFTGSEADLREALRVLDTSEFAGRVVIEKLTQVLPPEEKARFRSFRNVLQKGLREGKLLGELAAEAFPELEVTTEEEFDRLLVGSRFVRNGILYIKSSDRESIPIGE